MENDWWFDFFDDVYGDFILHTFNDDEIKNSINYLVKKFEINEKTKIYDQCCGKGSMAIPLLEKTNNIYGCDIIPSYIAHIKSVTDNGVFEVYDAKKYMPKEKVDVVINWHTSFGYSKNNDENIEMLKKAYESLKKDGVFILEYINFEFVVKNFEKKMVVNKIINNKKITLERFSSFENGMLKQKWSIIEIPEWEKIGETKIYFENDLLNIFENIGFRSIKVFYDLKESYEAKRFSPKMYIVAYK
jgi:SAM-dependent methyltransferase